MHQHAPNSPLDFVDLLAAFANAEGRYLVSADAPGAAALVVLTGSTKWSLVRQHAARSIAFLERLRLAALGLGGGHARGQLRAGRPRAGGTITP